MYELKKIGKVFTGKFVGTGPSSYKKRIYQALVSQSLRNTAIEDKGLHLCEKVLSNRFLTRERMRRRRNKDVLGATLETFKQNHWPTGTFLHAYIITI